ncbi:hypothetical protein M8C21_009413 [Ambrosia artemisiifolia]|uniref:Uncharacterized protein n=1 Tax=Ambrosia artemisiifolia TaxID=4212 RepID=A0AAD5CFG3_AMBAR|nr:hypothetical protein M8C21_009413 [Ambrosia artemisiifolia]
MNLFTNNEYELAINQSIQSLLDSLQNPSPDLSSFTSKFLELIQAKPDPDLEPIWVLSSLTFYPNNSQKDDILDQLSAVKDLFQLITAYSASSSPSVCIALTAPVIYKLYSVVNNLKMKEMDLKRGNKVRKEIKSFLDVILGYINICCEGINSDEENVLIRSLNELISIWVRSEGAENGSNKFFPLLSDEVIHWVIEESGENVGLLAGAVIVEAFLLKLCLKFNDGSSKQELRNELRTWAVCSVTGFHSFYLFDILVKMLLEPNLPVMKSKDYTEAVSYTNAFAGSHLPTLITKLVTSELGTNGNASQPKGSSPMAFLILGVKHLSLLKVSKLSV